MEVPNTKRELCSLPTRGSDLADTESRCVCDNVYMQGIGHDERIMFVCCGCHSGIMACTTHICESTGWADGETSGFPHRSPIC
jgi:hypothetical protein